MLVVFTSSSIIFVVLILIDSSIDSDVDVDESDELDERRYFTSLFFDRSVDLSAC
jgi:hypothetical protein